MATLVLTKLFINLMSTGQAVSAQTAPGRSLSYEIPGEVRTYAGGRQRSISGDGLGAAFGFTLRLVPRATVDTLVSWQGQTVQIRDHLGQRFFSVFHSVTPIEVRGVTGSWDVSISAHMVTVAEGI